MCVFVCVCGVEAEQSFQLYEAPEPKGRQRQLSWAGKGCLIKSKRMSEHTNMPELLNRFMETSNIAIKPAGTRLHRLVILRFLYSFGQCSDVATCIAKLLDNGVDLGVFNQGTLEVRLMLPRQKSSPDGLSILGHLEKSCLDPSPPTPPSYHKPLTYFVAWQVTTVLVILLHCVF